MMTIQEFFKVQEHFDEIAHAIFTALEDSNYFDDNCPFKCGAPENYHLLERDPTQMVLNGETHWCNEPFRRMAVVPTQWFDEPIDRKKYMDWGNHMAKIEQEAKAAGELKAAEERVAREREAKLKQLAALKAEFPDA